MHKHHRGLTMLLPRWTQHCFPAQRGDGTISVYMSAKQPPPPVPPEFEDLISQDVWDIRVSSIKSLASKYVKKRFERFWFILAVITCVLVPVFTHNAAVNAVLAYDANQSAAWYITAVTFVSTVGIFYLPVALWKETGKRRIYMMLRLWDLTDRRALGPSAFIPLWSVDGPAVFRSQIVLHLTIPPPEKPSLFKFHTDAYSPPPIRKPKVSHIKHDRFPPGLPRVPHMTSFPDFPPSPKYA